MGIDLWAVRRMLFLRTVVLGWLVLFGGLHVLQVARVDKPGEVSWDVRAQQAWLARGLSDADARFAGAHFPEGELFTYEFYGLALQNIAETTREPADLDRAEREVALLLPKLDALLGHHPFFSMAHWEVRGGICWFAGQNLLRARFLQLARSPHPAEAARFHADSAILHQAIQASVTGSLQAAPGASWPVDSLFGYRSLQLHDALYGSAYAAADLAKWEGAMRAATATPGGLMPSFLHLDGRARDVPRGCALSWTLAVLPQLDPAYAAQQWAAYRGGFGRCRWGLCLFREYPAGTARPPDADSGPMVGGYGMAATAFALAAARAEGDAQTAEDLRRTGELLSFPAVSWWGKRYLGGGVEFFDVLALWARTVPYPAPAAAAPDLRPALGLALAYLAAIALQLLRLRRTRAGLASAHGATSAQRALFGLAVALTALHLAWPPLSDLGWAAAQLGVGVMSSVLGALAALGRGRESLLRAKAGA